MNDKEKLAEIEENRRKIPPTDNLPKGEINWGEIVAFVLNEMTLGNGSLNWLILGDPSKTEMLSENSLIVLKLLESDMYDFFLSPKCRAGSQRSMERNGKLYSSKIRCAARKGVEKAVFGL